MLGRGRNVPPNFRILVAVTVDFEEADHGLEAGDGRGIIPVPGVEQCGKDGEVEVRTRTGSSPDS